MAIRLVDKIVNPPACCAICTAKPTDLEGRILPMIDAEIDIDWGNWLYICQDCAGIMAKLYGWARPEEVEELREKLERTETELSTAKEELEIANEQLDTMTKAREVLRKRREEREAA